jgi:HSP20 family molecular chaperone IbpA
MARSLRKEHDMSTDGKVWVDDDAEANGLILNEMEQLQDAISRRAYDLFQDNGSIPGRELDDWLAAEHEMISKPPIDFSEKDGRFEVRVAVPGIDPTDLEVQVTSACLLVKGEMKHAHADENATVHACEFSAGALFRFIEFPKRIDPDRVRAEFSNGMLILTARVAEEAA